MNRAGALTALLAVGLGMIGHITRRSASARSCFVTCLTGAALGCTALANRCKSSSTRTFLSLGDASAGVSA